MAIQALIKTKVALSAHFPPEIAANHMRLPSPPRAPAALGTGALRSAASSALALLLISSPMHNSLLPGLHLPAPISAAASAKELASGSGSRVNKDPLVKAPP